MCLCISWVVSLGPNLNIFDITHISILSFKVHIFPSALCTAFCNLSLTSVIKMLIICKVTFLLMQITHSPAHI